MEREEERNMWERVACKPVSGSQIRWTMRLIKILDRDRNSAREEHLEDRETAHEGKSNMQARN